MACRFQPSATVFETGRAGSFQPDIPENHYYPTPPEATRALIEAERAALARYSLIWEPCGRGGAIQRELAAGMGVATIATDIVADPAHDVASLDLMAARVCLAPAVVSNLPFAIGRAMVAHLWGNLCPDYMALLFKTTWLSCGEAAELWRAGLAPTRRWEMTWRLDFTNGGNPTMDCSWFIWDRRDPAPRFGLLDRARPVELAPAGLL